MHESPAASLRAADSVPPVSRLRVLFSDRTLLVLLLAGFSSGMPLFLVGKCLQAWFTQADVDLTTISYASLIGLPWSLKFLWAPFTDRLAPPGGRRRGWRQRRGRRRRPCRHRSGARH